MKPRQDPLALSALFVACFALSLGQELRRPTFDVASIRVAADYQRGEKGLGAMRGGPGTTNPGRIDYRYVSFRALFEKAFGVTGPRLRMPAAAEKLRYDISATLPPGSTPEQLLLMLQDLLTTRLHVRFRHALESLNVHRIAVAKDGPKLTPSTSAGQTISGGPRDSKFQLIGRGTTIPMLAHFLETVYFSDEVVLDATNLTGAYDFNIQFAPNSLAVGDVSTVPELATVLAQDLGLRIERGRESVEVMVVDSVDSAPTEN